MRYLFLLCLALPLPQCDPVLLPDEYCGELCRQGEYLFERMNG